MDSTQIRERSYRQVETLRHQNRREQRLLEDKLHSKQGIHAVQQYNLDQVSREQQNLKQELAKIRKTASTTWGLLPPKDDAAATANAAASGSGDRTGVLTIEKIRRRMAKRDAERKKRISSKAQETDQEPETPRKEEDMDVEQDEEQIASVTSPRKQTHQKSEETMGTDSQLLTPRSRKNRQSSISIAELDPQTAKDKVSKRLVSNTDPEKTQQAQQHGKISHGRIPEIRIEQHESSKTHALAPIVEKHSRESTLSMESDKVPDNVLADTREETKATAMKEPPKRTKPKHRPRQNANKGQDLSVGFDQVTYNPDGSLRTVHVLPDPDASFREARKARYIRNRGPEWEERALSVSDIFVQSKSSQVETADL